MNVLALCGSLRAASVNAALLRAAAQLAGPGLELRIFDGLGTLPLFNPDLDPPPPVRTLHAAVAQADALLIASPEYAHGVSGVLKNALDWLVACEAFVYKPVAVLNAAPRAQHADAALREILRTMSAVIVEPASLTIPLGGTHWTEAAMCADPAVAAAIRAALAALASGAGSRGPVFPLG